MTRFLNRTAKAVLAPVVAAALAAMLVPSVPMAAVSAYADELSDKKAELAPLSEEMSALTEKMNAAKAQVDDLQSQIDGNLSHISELQGGIADKQAELDEYVVLVYKMDDPGFLELLTNSETLHDFITGLSYIANLSEKTDRMKSALEDEKTQLDAQVGETLAKKDEQAAIVAKIESDKAALAEKMKPLEDRIDELEAEQKKKLAAAHSTFATDFSDGEWRTGTASAYGGSTDNAGSRTATGEYCGDNTFGVAIPLAWKNCRSYLGRSVEISYGGKSVIAKINDLGGMGGGSRALDLQPGVFKAFGFNSCNSWGLRTVSYRIL